MDDLNFPNPVTTAKDFFDRELELDTIQRTLASPTRRPVVILGERVIGKTSTLNILVERLKASPSFAIVRLPHSYSRDDFAAEILQGICEAVDTSLRQTGFVNGDGCLKIATVSEFMQMTEEQIAKRPGVSFVLCLDEFDSLLARCDADTANQILDLTLHLIERTALPLRFVFTMTQMTARILHSYASPFVNGATIVPLAPWSFEQARQFVEWLIGTRFVIDEEAHRLLFRMAAGQPYYTKAILRELIEPRREQARSIRVTAAQLHDAIAASVNASELKFTLANIWRAHFSKSEQDLMILLAASTTGLTESEIQTHAIECPKVPQRLAERGYIEKDERERYTWRLGIWGQWLIENSFATPAR